MWPYLMIPSYLTTIAALLGMIVGYHFLGPLGVLLCLGLVIAFIFVRARQMQASRERDALRRIFEQNDFN